jgi:hypothetical protein
MNTSTGRPIEAKLVMKQITVLLQSGADDQAIAAELQAQGMPPEGIPQIIALARRLGMADPAPAAAPVAGPGTYVPPAFGAASTSSNYLQAGRLIRDMAWLQALMAALLALAMGYVGITGQAAAATANGVPYLTIMGATIIILGVLVGGQMAVSAAIKTHQDWGRTVGIILGLLYLPAFPIGTLIGGLVLYHLRIKFWRNFDPNNPDAFPGPAVNDPRPYGKQIERH